jgi:hypothetical protein
MVLRIWQFPRPALPLREATMAITADGYYWIYSEYVPPAKKTGTGSFTSLTATSGAWTRGGSGSAELKSKAASHAERVAYEAMKTRVGKNKAFYLFTQNAFPCESCLDFYQAESAENYFIFIISEDQGSYSMDNGLNDYQLSYPQILYIQGGQRWYPGYVAFWTHGTDSSGGRTSTKVRALRSCTDPTIKARDGSVKKPQDWPDFPSISAYL